MEVVKRTPELSTSLLETIVLDGAYVKEKFHYMCNTCGISWITTVGHDGPASRGTRTAMREQGWAPCCLLRVNEMVRVGFGGRGGNECEGCVGPDVGDFSNML